MKSKYELWDFIGISSTPFWGRVTNTDKNGKPLMTLDQALQALNEYPDRPEMRVEKV